MEISWFIVLILLFIILVVSLQWSSARSVAAKKNTELETAQTELKDALIELDLATNELITSKNKIELLTSRASDLEANAGVKQFASDRVYKLLAKGEVSKFGKQVTYGVVEEDSGFVRPFLTEEILGHLEVGDCFGTLRGRLGKLDPGKFRSESDANQTATSGNETERNETPVTEAVHAAASDPDSGLLTSTPETLAKTAMFIPPETPQEPQDPTAGLPYLKIVEGEKQDEIIHLAFDKIYAGRGSDNDIVIQDDRASRVHFEVTFTNNCFLLRDNDSTNGTICNGEKIEQKWLEFGDKIQVGGTTLLFSCEGFDLKDDDAEQAVTALEKCIERQPDFITALKILAFMLERNIARKKEAASVWEKIARLEKYV